MSRIRSCQFAPRAAAPRANFISPSFVQLTERKSVEDWKKNQVHLSEDDNFSFVTDSPVTDRRFNPTLQTFQRKSFFLKMTGKP